MRGCGQRVSIRAANLKHLHIRGFTPDIQFVHSPFPHAIQRECGVVPIVYTSSVIPLPVIQADALKVGERLDGCHSLTRPPARSDGRH